MKDTISPSLNFLYFPVIWADTNFIFSALVFLAFLPDFELKFTGCSPSFSSTFMVIPPIFKSSELLSGFAFFKLPADKRRSIQPTVTNHSCNIQEGVNLKQTVSPDFQLMMVTVKVKGILFKKVAVYIFLKTLISQCIIPAECENTGLY